MTETDDRWLSISEICLHLGVSKDTVSDQQRENFQKIEEAWAAVGIEFTWALDQGGSIHARHIVTDHGWKISLDRGLDVFQHFEMNKAFSFANRMQPFRACKAFEITYIKI
jgi:ATP-dependent Lon protease